MKVKKQKLKKRKVLFLQLHEALNIWILQALTMGIIITESIICEKAKYFAISFSISDQFQFSNGWLNKFKKRSNIKARKIMGEEASAPIESLPKERNRLQQILSHFQDENIFNADETGLFF